MEVRRAAVLLAMFVVLVSVFVIVPTAAQASGDLVVTQTSQDRTDTADVTFTIAVVIDHHNGQANPPAGGAPVYLFVDGQEIGSATTRTDGTASIPYHFAKSGSVVVVYRVNEPPYTMTSGSFIATYTPSPSPTVVSSPTAQPLNVVPSAQTPTNENQGATPSASISPSTATGNETVLNLGSSSGGTSSPIDAIWWVIGLAAVILLAVIAAALLLLRRREYEGEDERYEDHYQRGDRRQ